MIQSRYNLASAKSTKGRKELYCKELSDLDSTGKAGRGLILEMLNPGFCHLIVKCEEFDCRIYLLSDSFIFVNKMSLSELLISTVSLL